MSDGIVLPGLGNPQAQLRVYIANRPPLQEYQGLSHCLPMAAGEISRIAAETGNHWRKVFNVYAKFVFELNPADVCRHFSSWQELRDTYLLQKGGQESLLFSAESMGNAFIAAEDKGVIHIVMGKQYASRLADSGSISYQWQDAHFAVNSAQRLIVCPYFDYRQLSNERITRLVGLVRELAAV